MSLPALNTAIYSRLGGTATSAGTAVFFLKAPDNQALPYILYDYVADIDENETQNRTRNAVIFLRAYATSQSLAGSIDGQIDTLMHNKPFTVTGWGCFWTARENGYSLPEIDQSGRQLFMVGADYRVRLQKT